MSTANVTEPVKHTEDSSVVLLSPSTRVTSETLIEAEEHRQLELTVAGLKGATADTVPVDGKEQAAVKGAAEVKAKKAVVRDTSSKFTLCVTMIVKNESAIIRRILDSVASIADYICITDTGSEDNTVELIKQWGEEYQIPTTVCVSEFRNFGYARNCSLRNTKKTYPKADFQMLLDGDFKVELNGFLKSELNLQHHSYTIKQYDKWKAWGNVRIVANWIDWEYHLRTHEYIAASTKQSMYAGEVRSMGLDTLRINDIGDGGCKSDKYERDIRLLHEDLEDPEVTDYDKIRCYYYLANSYKNGGRHKEAIPWYSKRVAAGGWFEEVYLSWCNIGECYQTSYEITKHAVEIVSKRQTETPNLKLIVDELSEYLTDEITSNLEESVKEVNKEEAFLKEHQLADVPLEQLITLCDQYFKDAIQNYMKGYAFCKIRAEALYAVVKMLRVRGDSSKGDHRKGLFLALEGLKIPIPKQCTLEVQNGVHTYGFDSEIMILAYYVPDQLPVGQAAKDRLSTKLDAMAGNYRLMYEQNKRFYN